MKRYVNKPPKRNKDFNRNYEKRDQLKIPQKKGNQIKENE